MSRPVMPTRVASALALVGLAALGMGLGGCGTEEHCQPGQFRFAGRPPRRLFSYDRSCRPDCFSDADASCSVSCNPIESTEPSGYVVDDRTLVLMDPVSLGNLPTTPFKPLVLVFTFRFDDPAGLGSPAGWDFFRAGKQSYTAGLERGTATFLIDAAVHELQRDSQGRPYPGLQLATLPSAPGRLDIRRAEDDRLKGRFFMSFDTPTDQPQGLVEGCFDLTVEPEEVGPSGQPTKRLVGTLGG